MTGRFVWYELMTTDTKSAIAFYTDVIGWKTQQFEGSASPEPYFMWVGSQGPLGGVYPLTQEAKKMGVPPMWMAHVEVEDVDGRAIEAAQLGGTVQMQPKDIPEVGRFAIITDPQGAAISIFKPSQPMTPHDTTKPGEFSWHELYAQDHPSAYRFYHEMFGWQQLSEMDMGAAGKYLIFGQGDKQYGGMMTISPDMKMPPSWCYYANVDDLDAAIGRATKRDAKVMFGPMEVPGGGRVAMLTDPQGAVFALHTPAKKN